MLRRLAASMFPDNHAEDVKAMVEEEGLLDFVLFYLKNNSMHHQVALFVESSPFA